MFRFVLIALSFLLFTTAQARPSLVNEGEIGANGSVASRVDTQQHSAEIQRHRHRHHHKRRRR
jgi:hypothetical protein